MFRSLTCAFFVGIFALTLSNCQTLSPEERLDRIGTVAGDSDLVYVVGTDSSTVNLNQIVSVAETIGVYKRLNKSESEKIRALAQKKLDGFVLAEMKAQAPKFESRKREIKRRTVSKISRASSSAAKKKIQAEERRTLADLEAEWRESALLRIQRTYGSDLAVPIRTNDNKPAVALTKVKNGQVQAPSVTYQLSAKPENVVRHEKVEARVIDVAVDLE